MEFAYSEPYTYTQLQSDLAALESSPYTKPMLRRSLLCRTIAGLRCDLLTISSESDTTEKQGVILTGRVHPGETVGSWMMKGALEFLLGSSAEAEELRRKYVFKVVPMLNPDGVVQGNYRTSLSGCDLNRRYASPSPVMHPSIFHVKVMAKAFAQQIPLAFYCDLHGHSKRQASIPLMTSG